uniref:Uncharacterized protein n=1 Tax=Phenylobacterium glaciei TaxID=2803784 RepID=A0A974S9Y9_9CAUL|nr:hypothetical protein JKL49_26290 [Phenylobacterium glaciei]
MPNEMDLPDAIISPFDDEISYDDSSTPTSSSTTAAPAPRTPKRCGWRGPCKDPLIPATAGTQIHLRRGDVSLLN